MIKRSRIAAERTPYFDLLDRRRRGRHHRRMDDLFTITGMMRRDPRIEAWFSDLAPHRLMVRSWWERLRGCGPNVRELLHDGFPVVCVADAPFAYVNAFKAHASIGFFRGALLSDPAKLLEGEGKRMRHVKLRPGQEANADALNALIGAAYADIRKRLGKA